MKTMAVVVLLLAALFLTLSVSAYAGDAKTVNAPCETAITKTEVLAARRKWWPERPDPKATVLNIRTHWNFSKDLVPVFGAVLPHEKIGEVVFEEQSDSCLVVSNGHPADVVLSNLAKAFEIKPFTSRCLCARAEVLSLSASF